MQLPNISYLIPPLLLMFPCSSCQTCLFPTLFCLYPTTPFPVLSYPTYTTLSYATTPIPLLSIVVRCLFCRTLLNPPDLILPYPTLPHLPASSLNVIKPSEFFHFPSSPPMACLAFSIFILGYQNQLGQKLCSSFQALADRVAIPCSLVRGDYNRAWNELMLQCKTKVSCSLIIFSTHCL